MSDSEQLMAEMESASCEMISNLDSLVVSAVGSFRLIEPYNAARSNHPEVTSIIESVKAQSTAYYRALDLSLVTAQHGHRFSCDAKLLCDSIMDVAFSTEDIQDFIGEMRIMVKQAYDEALQVRNRFRSVRTELFRITQRIPEESTKLEEEKRRAIVLKAKAERRKSFWNSNNTRVVATAGTAIVTVALGVVFPPAFIILPFILPIVDLMCDMGRDNALQKAASRETQAIQCDVAMEQLSKANNDINEIIRHIDDFAAWWQKQDTTLKSLSDGIYQLARPKFNKIRLAGVKKDWGKIEEACLAYTEKIGKLQIMM